jgi:hypothetical protein
VLTHHDFSDVADVVYIPAAGFDAPGNIGDAEAWSLDVNLSTPVPFIPHSRLTISGYLWDTEVTDPLTQRPRIISFQPESQIDLQFRQDIASWRMAWGVSAFKQGEVQAYRFNEIDSSEEGPWIDLWAETTALPYNMKLRATAANIFDGNVNRDRRFFDEVGPGPDFDPLGRNGANTSRDLRQRTFRQAPWFILELSGTF